MRSFAQVLQEGLPTFFRSLNLFAKPFAKPSVYYLPYEMCLVVESGAGKAIKHGPDGPSSQNPELWWESPYSCLEL